ncbi:MAG: restriction endonuclease subunit S [Treponema sp.]|nr:restriction endonuclease subunit S [Treponema sp.]
MEDCHTDSELLTQFHKKSPQLRFSRFKKIENEKLKDENWFSAPASEIFISVNDRNHPELPVLSASQELGMIYRDEGGMNIFHDVANEITYKRVRPGQFVIHLRSFQGGFAHSKVEGITSPAYTILDFKDRNKHNDLFWKYVLTSEEFIKRLELITYGIRDGRSINFSDFSTLKFHFPSYEVQKKIGAFLSHVDSLIQAKTKKLESLKAVKKSLLQKCFPKTDEKVPEMRFAGFSGNWEEKKLGEVAEISSGTTPSRMNSENFSGDICWLTSGELKSHYIYDTSEKINESIAETMRTYKKGTVVIAIYGLEAAGIRGTCSILKRDCTISQACMAFTNLKSVHNEFLYCWYIANGNEIGTKYAQGTKQQNLSSDIVSDMSICFPTLAEQQKIGQFFSKYDSLISAQQKEIDKLKDIKKSLLQKMFI